MASMYRSLIAAGFPSDLIRKELHRITRKEVPEVITTSNKVMRDG